MNNGSRENQVVRRTTGILRRVFFTLGALVLFIRDLVAEDVKDITLRGRLFLGVALSIVGFLSFTSDRYCDGNTADYYVCTRPSTYYYYPSWAIILIVVGVFLIVLWFLRRKNSH